MKNMFSKARVSNIVSGSVIMFTVYAVVFQVVEVDSLLVLSTVSGFAAKHLFAAELTVFMLLEFTLGPIWVWIFINEVPTIWTLVGGSIVISAVFVKTVSELRKTKV